MATHRRRCKTIGAAQLQNLQRIGGGSFGDIFKAWHMDWRTDVAVKKLNRNVSEGLEELISEAEKMELASPIPYVIRLYGMYENETNNGDICHGIVMEYMENGSVASLLNRVKPVPSALKVRILHEVALGMNRLHDLRPPLLHLDLKLSNVLLDGDLHARIADFGLSRFKRGPSLAPGTAEDYGGTLEYMPPECLIENVNYRPTQMFDVYSYGILMWAVLTGQEPYPAAHPDIIRLRIPQDDRPDLGLLGTEGPVERLEDLKVLMQRCWVKDPLQRPSFRECSAETEKVFSAHKPEIYSAVGKVQQILIHMATLSPEDAGSRQEYPDLFGTGDSPIPSSAATSDSHMSSYIERFQTLHLSENPSQNLGAVPIRPSGAASLAPTLPQVPPLPKPDPVPHHSGHPCGPQQACGTDTPDHYCPYPEHPQSLHSTMTSGHYGPPMSPPYFHWSHYQQMPPSMPDSNIPGPIHFSGSNIKNVQIGHGNTMTISGGSMQERSKKKKKYP